MQKLQLSIPEPCHENWQQMTPTNQGRFCNACVKEVVDFSMMTDTEVLNYFTTLTHDKVCGRALPSQLDRTITRPKDPKKRLFWYWNYVVMFFMFFGKGNSAKAQGGVKRIIEQSPVKTNDVRGQLLKAGELKKEDSRVITGKVTDIDGNPARYASIKIKGTVTGVSADSNGVYRIRVKDNPVLIISGAGFKATEIAVGSQNAINSVLDYANAANLKEVVVSGVFGGMRLRNMDEDYVYPDKIKNLATIKVKDEETGKILQNAAIEISTYENLNTAYTDKKGMYKMKGIKAYENYFIKVMADGYELSEFTIDARDFKDRKKEWEVLLRKQKAEPIRSTETAKPGKKTMVRMGGVSIFEESKQALYVVDGKIVPPGTDINPDDVDDYSVLQPPEATALFGSQGANGAIVITTRKAKEIKLKEVVVTSEYGIKGTMGMAGGIRYTNIYEDSFLSDTIATVKTLLTNSIKVYPNPVQRNAGFSVSLKLKQAGQYSIQVTDASGRILLQQKFNTIVKDHTEKIMGDSRWAGGVYYIRVFDANNKLLSKSSFIFQ